jgi:hypothetical protein
MKLDYMQSVVLSCLTVRIFWPHDCTDFRLHEIWVHI